MSSSDKIILSDGNGGIRTRALIDDVISKHLKGLLIDTNADATCILQGLARDDELLFTSDSFTVQPLFFPGGDIGSLAIHGTVNDLAVAGAKPLFISLNLIIEEGLDLTSLNQILSSLATSARSAKIRIAAGDTKVVPKGEASGIYLSTSGIGVKDKNITLGFNQIDHGDHLITSGSLGDHGAAITLARQQFGLSGNIESDSADITALVQEITKFPGVKFMRDPTRGGLSSVLHDINRATQFGIQIQESALPIKSSVKTFCEILGFEPLVLPSEGRFIALVSPDISRQVVETLRQFELGREARIIGQITNQHNHVTLKTEFGGERFIEELDDEPLPRIC